MHLEIMLSLATLGLATQTVLKGASGPYASSLGKGSTPSRQLDDSFCPAHTEHFTGSIQLEHGKDLFYC
jgi:hypothetical protein